MTFHDDSSNTERELSVLFDALRESEAERTPDAGPILSRARARAASGHSRPRWFPFRISLPLAAAAARALGIAIAVAIPAYAPLAVWNAVITRREISNFRRVVSSWTEHPALGAWRSPTDFLLDVPGHELLSTVPQIGQPDATLLPGQPAGTRANDSTNGDRT